MDHIKIEKDVWIILKEPRNTILHPVIRLYLKAALKDCLSIREVNRDELFNRAVLLKHLDPAACRRSR